MAAEEMNIIAIELGSSKVIGVAGTKRSDGKIEVTAHVQQDASKFIRKGIIYNADLAVSCVKNIIEKLEEKIQKKIFQVYVSYSGQGIHSVHNEVIRSFEEEEHKILKEDIDSIYDENTNYSYEGQCILDTIPQEFSVGTQKLSDAVGVMGNRIEGRYLNIIAKSKLLNYIENCFKNIGGVRVVEYKLTPLVVADQLLNEAQKNSGCVLVDIGADTTTVSIYKSKLLRFLSVIPLGSDNITKDIMSLQLEHKEAEELKVSKFGEPYASFTEDEGEAIIRTTPDGIVIKRKELSSIIDARLTEILINVKQQINESKYVRESLVAGAFLTGGGANMPNISNVFKEVVGIDKVTVRKNSQSADYILPQGIKNSETRFLAALGLIANANQNCTTDSDLNRNMFVEEETPVEPLQTVEEQTADDKEQTQAEKDEKTKKPSVLKSFINKFATISKRITEE
ncbi:MAG: cell division protein FtsA [Prevotellaceae bacterium]|nr:cell division protein FtsA [Prevotellaceae bacterium]